MTSRKFMIWLNFFMVLICNDFTKHWCIDVNSTTNTSSLTESTNSKSKEEVQLLQKNVNDTLTTDEWWNELKIFIDEKKEKEKEMHNNFKRSHASAQRHRDIVANYNLTSAWGDNRSDNFAEEAPRGEYWNRWSFSRGDIELPIPILLQNQTLSRENNNTIWWGNNLPSVEEYKNRPLISLVMMVKNENTSIRHTIDSVSPWVDRYTILDTYSTDGTAEIIKEAFGDTPGDIYFEPFVNFGETRNRVLELEGTKSVFTLMLSGDESLVDGEILRKFCEAKSHPNYLKHSREEAYNIQIAYGTEVYDSTRLARTDAQWFYTGVTHEYMTSGHRGIAKVKARYEREEPHIHHDLSNRDIESKKRSWARDLDLLLNEWDRNPNRTRTAFYIAQSYECIDKYDEAYIWYERRFAMGGWHEEAYEAKYRMARCAREMGKSWPEVQQIYLDAHSYLPARAEPLYDIAMHWYEKEGDIPLTYIFVHRAKQIPFPTHLKLFIQRDVYDVLIHDLFSFVAFYMKDYETGWESLLLSLRYDPEDNEAMKSTIKLYEEHGFTLPDDLVHLNTTTTATTATTTTTTTTTTAAATTTDIGA